MQESVVREEKMKKFRRLGKKTAAKARPLSPFWTVPIRHPVILGTKPKKAVNIQRVRISTMLFHSSLITLHSALLYIVKMLQFLKKYVVCNISYVGKRNRSQEFRQSKIQNRKSKILPRV